MSNKCPITFSIHWMQLFTEWCLEAIYKLHVLTSSESLTYHHNITFWMQLFTEWCLEAIYKLYVLTCSESLTYHHNITFWMQLFTEWCLQAIYKQHVLTCSESLTYQCSFTTLHSHMHYALFLWLTKSSLFILVMDNCLNDHFRYGMWWSFAVVRQWTT